MSVRKVYSVLVGHEVVFSGSYKVAMDVYSAVFKTISVCSVSPAPVVSISFQPQFLSV